MSLQDHKLRIDLRDLSAEYFKILLFNLIIYNAKLRHISNENVIIRHPKIITQMINF